MKSQITSRDARHAQTWREIESFFNSFHGPSFGKVSDADDLTSSPDHKQIAFTGLLRESLRDRAVGRICILDCEDSSVHIAARGGSGSDEKPQWSADGELLAFLSDREERDDFQVMIGPAHDLAKARAVSLEHHVAEYLAWSPQGRKLLIGMAGEAADRAGGQGSGILKDNVHTSGTLPTWMPQIDAKDDPAAWRSLWMYDEGSGLLRRVLREGLNVWEAVWCGVNHALAIASDDPGEHSWYTARLVIIDLETGLEKNIYQSSRQISNLASSSQGNHIAITEALCSDRGVAAGEVLLFDWEHDHYGNAQRLNTNAIDITSLTFRDEQHLVYSGIRGLRTAAGTINLELRECSEVWTSSETCGRRYPRGAPYMDGLAVVAHSWTRTPEIAAINHTGYRTLFRLDHAGADWLCPQLGPVEELSWHASDGLLIEGLLYRPKNATLPLPTILSVHGGPIWSFRNCATSFRSYIALLVCRGYAVFCVNPRGSAGRGQKFAEMVRGDMGGADTSDFLSGLDMLVNNGIADPIRLGVQGGSYGGFMSAWLITQTDRFAAAVPQSPVIDWLTQHTTSNIGFWDLTFLDGKPYDTNGLYAERSPLRLAGRFNTPVLQISGARDRCTPPVNAVQYHNALLERGVETVLITYPEEGHGVRKFPAYIDMCFRMLSWFDKYVK